MRYYPHHRKQRWQSYSLMILALTVIAHAATPKGPAKTATTRHITAPHKRGPFTNSIGMRLALIPYGRFTMGSDENNTEERPSHEVQIDQPFYMGTTEVTQGQWKAVMGTQPWKGKKEVQDGADYPVVYVNWDDAKEFCRRLSKKEGRKYRLPSEAEWEYAARSNSNTQWCFGDDETSLEDYAWYHKNAWGIGEKYAHRVGTKEANVFGLYDMHGNVWEWCEDVWHDNYQGAPTDGSAWVHGGNQTRRVTRGGSFGIDPILMHSSSRTLRGTPPSSRDSSLGFRVVTEAPPLSGHEKLLELGIDLSLFADVEELPPPPPPPPAY